jgi:lysylphosphatidylglycerol synthetase-like protein (DUF2156 family)
MIDVRTTYGLIAVVFLIAPIAILLTTRGMRNRQIYCWVAANAAHGLAYILVGLRDSIPDAMSYHLAQVLLLSSALARPTRRSRRSSETCCTTPIVQRFL